MKLPNSRTLFLIDSLVSLLAAVIYGFVLVDYREIFGFSRAILIALSCFSFIYTAYSGICFFLSPKLWRSYLAIIATANFLRSGLVIYFIYSFYSEVSTPGLICFAGEMALMAFLSIFELKVCFSNRKMNPEELRADAL